MRLMRVAPPVSHDEISLDDIVNEGIVKGLDVKSVPTFG